MPDLEQTVRSLETASLHVTDMRRHPRYVSVYGGVLRLAVRPEFRGRRALLFDVSAGGIGFLLEDKLDAGTMLTFELQGPEGTQPMARVARVRHCRPHPVPADAPWLPQTPAFSRFLRGIFCLSTAQPKTHAWLVGCEFDRLLSDDELDKLVIQLKSLSTQPQA